MTDRLRTAWARIEAACSRLGARALDDLDGAAYPTPHDGPNVTGGSGSSPTETSRLAWAATYKAVADEFERIAGMLDRLEDRITPTGGQCPTRARDEDTGEVVRCTGQVVRDGRCEQCASDWRARRNLDIPAAVIRERNARRPRWCDCPEWCCERDAGGHTSCRDQAAPGRTVSERCKKRMDRARQAAG